MKTFHYGLSRIVSWLSLIIGFWVPSAFAASSVVTFTQLTGVTGGVASATAVFRADLSSLGLGTIQSLTIQDNSGGVGGSPGQFSGFDLDAIKLSTTLIGDAPSVNGIAGLSVFNFSPAGTLFTAGTQRPPVDPALFGTSGSTINNAVATLGLFDGESVAAVPGAFGFVSMGDGGIVSFNLTSSVSTTGLFLYIGEVGNNGEVAAGRITASDVTVSTPEPETYAMMLAGLGLLGFVAWRRNQRSV